MKLLEAQHDWRQPSYLQLQILRHKAMLAVTTPSKPTQFDLMTLANALTYMRTIGKPHIMIGAELWATVMAHEGFQMCFEPESTLAELKSGLLGSLFGVLATTDGYDHPLLQRVIPKDWLVIVAQDEKNGDVVNGVAWRIES